MKNRIRDYGINIGKLKTGINNLITDVPGVKVGHVTLRKGNINTGVTAIIPHEGNIFKEKLVACSHVINGFGKTVGTVQIEELGTLETPILLTNTLNVGLVSDALIEYMLKENEDIGVTTGTINPVVCECNDGYLNCIRERNVSRGHVFESIESADVIFKEGAVGAGTGMTCYGFKGGIGSASRIIELDSKEYTIGVLTLTNFGRGEDLVVDGEKIGEKVFCCNEEDKGSCIIIVATDIPLSYRQIKRVCKRASVGMARTGSFIGNGSGEIVIGFTTANKINHYEDKDIISIKIINEDKINLIFRGVAEAVEEAVLNSLACSETLKGRDGHVRQGFGEILEKL
ncbi:P1 family peptidase [Haloimpatiens lingqiaonensis]|uniref:DmpA family aminopeptidase n=1 Tax=Haloimpatiens lingqiaonensis TaxID=1380675 RepID=UPI0010FD732D|nr:P1 family peptidase [Haloimpatiens lingqiaonensis]